MVAIANTLGASEAGLDRAFILIDGKDPADQVAHKKPKDKTNEDSEWNIGVHRWSLRTDEPKIHQGACEYG